MPRVSDYTRTRIEVLDKRGLPPVAILRSLKNEGLSVSLASVTRIIKHGAILYNEAEVFSLSITNPNGRPMLPFDWLIQSSLILGHCHKLFSCFLRLRNKFEN